ncbi:MAG TPA: SAM-dependent chlorinase/fluorinase [Herpetosiphonaceae bacterium]|nr:SAM-dependent chlorinase/fluorinase [Herpetosiphonaceae bacterium]
MKPNGIITLLTDFGLQDEYVGAMKGVILGIAPHARLVDITHQVAPQAIGEASYLLGAAYPYFPPGTVHIAVVDPGVGSERRAIALTTPAAVFLGPDNGLLAPVLEAEREQWGERAEVRELSNRSLWRSEVSRTFHGRDIFAPTAAHLLNDVPLAGLGNVLVDVHPSAVQPPQPDGLGVLHGEIVHVDRFGNCISNITRRHLRDAGLSGALRVEIAGQRVAGLYATYSAAAVGIPIALIGSSGHLELAVRDGQASRALEVLMGARLCVTAASG